MTVDYLMHKAYSTSSKTYKKGNYIITKNRIKAETKTVYNFDFDAEGLKFHSMVILLHVMAIIFYALIKTVFFK
jgi:hypothetical protein